jgi:surface antigen/peptidoglycan hydrolase CwlO-like protein
MAAILVTGALPMSSLVQAATQAELDAVRNQLNEVREKIRGYEAEARRLSGEANTLNNRIAMLRAQENVLMASIQYNEAEHERLVIVIDATEKRINNNLEMMGYIVAQYYHNDGVSTLERLASAENWANFVDTEARLSNLSENLSNLVAENKVLRAEQEADKQKVEAVLADLEIQREDLVARRSEQQRLLAETRGQERAYQNLRTAANAERERLEAEQQRILRAIELANSAGGPTAGDPNKGGYPWAHLCGQAKWNGTQFGDTWGMFICECVSYTAWKVHQAYRNMPFWGGRGNANQWVQNARNAGIPVGTVPKVGSVGAHNNGPFGHVVWVEAIRVVNGVTQVYISQYNSANAATGWRSGMYSELWMNASAFPHYIYFGDWRR